MLAAQDVRLAKEAARDLRKQGQEARARAIEAVLGATLVREAPPMPERVVDYLTAREAARALAVPVRTIRDWLADGQLHAVVAGGQTLIPRGALTQLIDRLRANRPVPYAPTAAEKAARRRQRKFVLGGLPADKLGRLEALHEKMEGRRTPEPGRTRGDGRARAGDHERGGQPSRGMDRPVENRRIVAAWRSRH